MTSAPQADYTTLAAVREAKNIGALQTSDDATLKRFIRQGSKLIDIYTKRHFMPYVDSKTFGPECRSSAYDLDLRDDLLSVTSITTADGSALSGGQYRLRPDNATPKQRVELVSSGSLYWSFPYRESRVSITGIWGCHTDYSRAWGDSLDTVQNAPLTGSSTTLNVVNGSGTDDRGLPRFEVGDILLLENEQVKITGINANALTILRAQNGTSAAAHNVNTPILVYRQMEDIRFACNEMVKWLYEHRDRADNTVQLTEGLGVVVVRELPEVRALLEMYRPIQRILAV